MIKFFTGLLLTIVCAVLLTLIFRQVTNRICDKPFSEDFKQTQGYKDMKCPN